MIIIHGKKYGLLEKVFRRENVLGSFLMIVVTGAGVTPIMNATLETSAGEVAMLSGLISKPTVIFYEDRDSTKLNQHVKDALFEQGKEKGLLGAVGVVAIANVKEWNWFPARNFVLKAVREVEAKVHIAVYLDFAGSMTSAPWSLPSKTSTVMVVDAHAQPLLQFKGRLSAEEQEKLFEVLETLSR